MARMRVFLDGRTEVNGCPLLMHNERMMDPLNEYAIELAKISKKRGKTEVDHVEMGRLEFVGGLYYTEQDGPIMPVGNIVRMIQEAAKRHKLGRNIMRGVIPATQHVPVLVISPETEMAIPCWTSTSS